jgi:phospholipase/lecithinase/hemolysin
LTQRLIKAGAMHLVVPGNLPMGCSSAYLTLHPGRNSSDYDSAGCLKTYNDFTQRHNAMVQQKLQVLRLKYPHARIMYADYYGAAMSFARNPKKFGEYANQSCTPAACFRFIKPTGPDAFRKCV